MDLRVHKWLSQQGIASRREAESWIRGGRVAINGVEATLGSKVDPETDAVTVDGRPIRADRPPLVYWLLNKPDKCLTSHKGDDGKPTVFDLPRLREVPFKLFTVGRLDFRTEGLLILSNDGEFVNRMTHPRFKVPRSYYCMVDSRLTEAQEVQIRNQLVLEDGPVGKIEITFAHRANLGASHGFWYFITVYEGRNRLVRRIFEHFGYKVVRLVRHKMGTLDLPESLKPGDYIPLTTQQIEHLKRGCGMISPRKSMSREASDEARNHSEQHP